MIYEIKTTRKAVVNETIISQIEAETLEECMDIAYDLASNDPTELVVNRWTIVEREYKNIEDIDSSLEEVIG